MQPTSDQGVRSEQALIGSLLLDPSRWNDESLNNLSVDDFVLSDHRLIWRTLNRLHGDDVLVDLAVLASELDGKVDHAYLISLMCNGAIPLCVPRYAREVHKAAAERRYQGLLEQLMGAADADDREAILAELSRLVSDDGSRADGAKIRAFADIPDVLTMKTDPVEWLVPGMIARHTITLWTGVDGSAKTFMVQNMAIAIASGGQFLGRPCHRARVIYFDYENAIFFVRERLELMSGGPVPDLRVWGTWLEQQPPQVGSEVMLNIAKREKPLLVVDPLRLAHGGDENDASEMSGIMRHLRHCATEGAAVVVLHHPPKQGAAEAGRGSSAIRGAVDVAFLQERSEDSDLISLKCVKNRFAETWITTIKPDFEEGRFKVTDSPQWARRNADVEKLYQVIERSPGLSQNAICRDSGMKKGRVLDLLREGVGTRWRQVKDGTSLRYFPSVPEQREPMGTREPLTQ